MLRFSYEVTLGPNGWEQFGTRFRRALSGILRFYLLRNKNWSKKIYPAMHKSWKDMPCVGPHKGRERQMLGAQGPFDIIRIYKL